MDFPAVVELLDYWLEYPPEHLLLRAFVGYEGQKGRTGSDSWRQRRAEEMNDFNFKESKTDSSVIPEPTAVQAITGGQSARKLDCAPPHIQLAVERAKQGKHMDIPEPE